MARGFKGRKILSAVMSGTLALTMLFSSTALAAEQDAEGKYYYTSEYASRQAVLDAGNQLAREIAGEGMVLLKNTAGALPVAKGANITVLGKDSVNPVYSGGGSGNGALGAGGDPTDLYEALEATGFNVNPVMKAFYEDDEVSGEKRGTGSVWGMIGRTIGYSTYETPVESYGEEQLASLTEYNDMAIVYFARLSSEGSDLPRSSWQVTESYNSWRDAMMPDYSSGHAVVDENGNPIPVAGRSDGSEHYLELDDNEKAVLELAKSKFGKVVVVINSGNPLECGALQADDGVSAIIWAGNPGGSGFLGLGDILNGDVNPSGHLTDTWAADFTKSPTYNNFSQGPTTSVDYDSTAKLVGNPGEEGTYFDFGSGNAFYVDGDESFTIGNNTYLGDDGLTYSYNRYVKYKEGIYVGYKYYETMADMIAQQAGQEAADAWYANRVVYPFGYGLSYTTFDWAVESSSIDLSSPLAKSTVTVKVTNTGDVAGKDVVQLYGSAPYTEGDPEKSSVVLTAYGKTNLLQPGESETLTLTFDAYDLASWDNGYAHDDTKGAYVLNDGTYTFTLRTDAHSIKAGTEAITADKADDLYITTDPTTGALLQTELDVATEIINGTELTTLSRADMKGATADEIEDNVLNGVLGRDSDDVRHINQEQLEELYKNVYFKQTYTTAEAIDAYDSDKEYFQTETPKYSAGNVKEDGTPYMFSDLIGVDPTTEEGAKLYQLVVENASIEELATTVINGSHRITGIESIGMPGQLQEDGPGGFNTQSDSMAFCNNIVIASTWNLELAQQMGDIMGEVALWENIGGWYAPSVNIHRNEFAGRNFEYFAEDAMLSGDMVAAQIKGATAKGLMCTLKHFALNEQDTDRGRSNDGVLTYADEQCIRELYLKPFEIAVKEGDATCLMGSFNRVGNYWSSSIRALNIDILRGEWGFKGAIITDANSGSYMQADMNIRGGVDWDLTSAGRLDVTIFVGEDGTVSATDTTIYLMQEAIKHIMYATTKTNAINEVLGYIAEDGTFHTTNKLEQVTDPAGTHTRLNYIPLDLAD